MVEMNWRMVGFDLLAEVEALAQAEQAGGLRSGRQAACPPHCLTDTD
jgi:hypothetical protein